MKNQNYDFFETNLNQETNNGGQRDPFETCYQLWDEATYCWSKSYNDIGSAKFNKCFPMSADRTNFMASH